MSDNAPPSPTPAVTPDGRPRSISPYVGYPDGDAAAEWLQTVFGFGPAKVSRDDQGRWFEGELAVGHERIHISGSASFEPDRNTTAFIVFVDDVDALHARVRSAGVESAPPRDEPYGPRICDVRDPWGYQWYFWQGEAAYPP